MLDSETGLPSEMGSGSELGWGTEKVALLLVARWARAKARASDIRWGLESAQE